MVREMNFYLLAYIIATLWELYLFTAQRAALELGRDANLPAQTSQTMLPFWYMTLWPNRIFRWIMLYFIYLELGLVWVAVLVLIPFLLTTFIPIPFRHFVPKFEKKLKKNNSMGLGDHSLNMFLITVLIRSKRELGMLPAEEVDIVKNTKGSA